MICIICIPQLKVHYFFCANGASAVNKMFGNFSNFGYMEMLRY